jgi:hypothetical protein
MQAGPAAKRQPATAPLKRPQPLKRPEHILEVVFALLGSSKEYRRGVMDVLDQQDCNRDVNNKVKHMLRHSPVLYDLDRPVSQARFIEVMQELAMTNWHTVLKVVVATCPPDNSCTACVEVALALAAVQ